MNKPIRLLLVEDNPGDVRTIVDLVSAFDHQCSVESVARIADAVSAFQDASDPFDLVLLDLSLPDSQGLGTFDELNSRTPDAAVVILTGLDDEGVALQAVGRGAQDYLVKGRFDAVELDRVIRYALERHRIIRELQDAESRLKQQRDVFARELSRITGQYEEHIKELSVVRRTGEAMRRARDPHRVYEITVSTILEETKAENCSLMLLDDEDRTLRVETARGQTDAVGHFFQSAGSGGRVFRLGEGVAGWVAQYGEPVWIPDCSTSVGIRLYPDLDAEGQVVEDPDLPDVPTFAADLDDAWPIGCMLCFPLILDRVVVGVVNVSHPLAEGLDREDERLVAIIIEQAMLALGDVHRVERLSGRIGPVADTEKTVRGTLRVLLVEDHPGDAKLVEESLKESGDSFDLVRADRLSDAIDDLQEMGVDVLLLDLSLPDVQGADTVSRARASAPDIPIVVLTGNEDIEVAVSAVHHGVQDFLVKGQFNGESLSRALRYAVERHQLMLKVVELQDQLLAAERDQVVAETAGSAAHEINQPLTVIVGRVDLLVSTLPEDDPLLPHLASINDAAKRITGIVERMDSIKRYASTEYVLGTRILDLDSASAQTEQDSENGST